MSYVESGEISSTCHIFYMPLFIVYVVQQIKVLHQSDVRLLFSWWFSAYTYVSDEEILRKIEQDFSYLSCSKEHLTCRKLVPASQDHQAVLLRFLD